MIQATSMPLKTLQWREVLPSTVKPVYNDHLYNIINCQWFIQ